MKRLLTFAFVFGLCAMAAAQPKPDDPPRTVRIQFLGGAKTVALEGLKIVALSGDYAHRKMVADGTTNEDGHVALSLAPGYFHVELTSPKELPYFPLPVGYTGHPSWYGRSITVKGQHDSMRDRSPCSSVGPDRFGRNCNAVPLE